MDEVIDGERGPRTGYGIKMGVLGWAGIHSRLYAVGGAWRGDAGTGVTVAAGARATVGARWYISTAESTQII